MIKDVLKKDQLAALKAGRSEEVVTIRYILSQIQNKEIEKKSELNDEEIVQVIRRQAKEIKESRLAAEKGGRTEGLDRYQKELDMIAKYLPAELSDEDLKKEIEVIVKKNEELFKKNPQALTGICIKELKNKADPGRIVGILRTV